MVKNLPANAGGLRDPNSRHVLQRNSDIRKPEGMHRAVVASMFLVEITFIYCWEKDTCMMICWLKNIVEK